MAIGLMNNATFLCTAEKISFSLLIDNGYPWKNKNDAGEAEKGHVLYWKLCNADGSNFSEHENELGLKERFWEGIIFDEYYDYGNDTDKCSAIIIMSTKNNELRQRLLANISSHITEKIIAAIKIIKKKNAYVLDMGEQPDALSYCDVANLLFKKNS